MRRETGRIGHPSEEPNEVPAITDFWHMKYADKLFGVFQRLDYSED